MSEVAYAKMIRRVRNSGLLFHESDDIADRASNLLKRLLDAKHQKYPYGPPVDRFGNTHHDRIIMAKNGLCQADFM